MSPKSEGWSIRAKMISCAACTIPVITLEKTDQEIPDSVFRFKGEWTFSTTKFRMNILVRLFGDGLLKNHRILSIHYLKILDGSCGSLRFPPAPFTAF